MFINLPYMQLIHGKAKARSQGEVKATFIEAYQVLRTALKDCFLSHLNSLSLVLSLSLGGVSVLFILLLGSPYREEELIT